MEANINPKNNNIRRPILSIKQIDIIFPGNVARAKIKESAYAFVNPIYFMLLIHSVDYV